MLARRFDETAESPGLPRCATCAARQFSFCQAVDEAASRPTPADLVEQSEHTVPARRIICGPRELYDIVPIICEGWAAAVVVLPDATRQILSFLLPGDFVSTALLFGATPDYSVEAITEVRYRAFMRGGLRRLLFGSPDLVERLSRAWIEEKARADQLIIDLGRRTSEERLARLILNLADRLAERGMAQEDPLKIEFPLRQHHIADALGLSPVHVSKVMSDFRRSGLIDTSERWLTILDLERLRRVADLR